MVPVLSLDDALAVETDQTGIVRCTATDLVGVRLTALYDQWL